MSTTSMQNYSGELKQPKCINKKTTENYTLVDYFETSERKFQEHQNGKGNCTDADFSTLNPYWNMY